MFPQHVLKPSQSLGICATAALIGKRVDLFSVHAYIFKEFSTKHEVNSYTSQMFICPGRMYDACSFYK